MVTPFEKLLGNTCELRLLEFLLPLKGTEFSIIDLKEEMGVSIPTITKIVKKFVEWGLLKPTSLTGNAAYTLNLKSPIIQSIEQFNLTLIEHIITNET